MKVRPVRDGYDETNIRFSQLLCERASTLFLKIPVQI